MPQMGSIRLERRERKKKDNAKRSESPWAPRFIFSRRITVQKRGRGGGDVETDSGEGGGKKKSSSYKANLRAKTWSHEKTGGRNLTAFRSKGNMGGEARKAV